LRGQHGHQGDGFLWASGLSAQESE
jgi:hypothetical protein